jgi:putative ABC transport system permease protein
MVDMYRVFFALPDLATHRYPDLLAIGVLVSVGFAVLGTLRGVRRAVRLAPADAMRPPPPERGGRVLPERIPALWRRLSFRARLVLRTVFRNPFRSTVSVAASVIATALVFVALSMVDALDYLMAYEFQRVAHQDLTVVLRDPKAHQAVDEVVRLPGMAAGEAQLGVTCDLSHGAYRKRLGIIGLPPGGRLFTPLDPAGHPIPIPEHGLVLTRKLAEILHVRPGDTLRLRPLIGWRVEVTAPVAALVDSYLGLTAYADLDYLSRLLGEETVGNQVLGKQADASQTDALLEALKQRPSVVGIGERRRALDQIEATFGATMGAMIGIMVLMAGAIAFGSVLNAVLVSLDERRREVGTLRVLGYFPGQVAGLFAGESLLLNALGIALGLYAGVGLAHAIAAAYSTELYRFPAVILPATLVLSAVVMAAFVGLAQLVVYRLVRRLDWLAVLNVRE